METITLQPLRWMDESARVSILDNDGHPQSYLQVTAWRNIESACIGRPVEELPRILTMLSPSHHVVSAMALDRLFDVEPPPLALNLREALQQALFFTHHLRKLYFFLCSLEDPFLVYCLRGSRGQRSIVSHHLLDRVMDHVTLTQEAAAVLGGRADHPVVAVPGGVGRFLKEPHYTRLQEIAEACLGFAVGLAAFLGAKVFGDRDALEGILSSPLPRMSTLTIPAGTSTLVAKVPGSNQDDSFAAEQLFEKVGFHREPWTYKPFAYLKDKGWNSLEPDHAAGLFFVGPLARLNGGSELATPRAEEERQRLVEVLGPFPHFTVTAACRSLAVELIQAAERMTALCTRERLTGPAIRVIPTAMNRESFAAMESPQGLIAHHYTTDARGIVQEVQVLDTSVANNALRCLLVRQAVEESKDSLQDRKRTKSRIEASLLPF
jgi:F420-non-reducing hydrogenase large subunit